MSGNAVINPDALSKINLNPNVHQLKLTDGQYKSVLNDMVCAFWKNRGGCETERAAEKKCREVLNTCLSCFHPDGRVWLKAPGKPTDDWTFVLAQRLRVWKYDFNTKKLLLVGRKKGVPVKDIDGYIKPGTRAKEPDSSESSRTLSLGEEETMRIFIEQFKKDFPSSITIADEVMIKRLAFLMVLSDRDISEIELSKGLTEEIKVLTEALGVSGKQRIAYTSKESSGTLEELSTKYKKTLDEYIEIETSWKLEELSLISNAVHRGTTPEFLAMSWVKILYGNTIDGKDINLKRIDKFLKQSGITVNG